MAKTDTVSKMLHLNQSKMASTGHVYCHTSLSEAFWPLDTRSLVMLQKPEWQTSKITLKKMQNWNFCTFALSNNKFHDTDSCSLQYLAAFNPFKSYYNLQEKHIAGSCLKLSCTSSCNMPCPLHPLLSREWSHLSGWNLTCNAAT